MNYAYVSWTDPATGRREHRTFTEGQRGCGALRRRLRRQGIEHESGVCTGSPRDRYTPLAPREGRAWRVPAGLVQALRGDR